MITEQKAEIRTQLKQFRASIPENVRQEYSRAITQKILELEEIRRSRHIFLYISREGEVNTHDLINALLDQGKNLAVPKIMHSEYMAAVPFTTWHELETGQLGILSPRASDPMNADIDVVITPGLGFTSTGHRIGYGRGYYDKWFARNKVQHKIALAFEVQIIEALPVEEFDMPVNMIVTEKRTIEI